MHSTEKSVGEVFLFFNSSEVKVETEVGRKLVSLKLKGTQFKLKVTCNNHPKGKEPEIRHPERGS